MLETDEFFNRLVAGTVASTLAVAYVGDRQILCEMVGEHVLHAKNTGIEVDTASEVIGIEREVVDEVSQCFWVRWGI